MRKAGNNLRITAQLIDGMTDTHIWAEKYNGNLDDIFEIQEKVSRSIVDSLKLKISPEEKELISKNPTKNLEAYNLYLKGRFFFFNGSREGQIQNSLPRAIEISGNLKYHFQISCREYSLCLIE